MGVTVIKFGSGDLIRNRFMADKDTMISCKLLGKKYFQKVKDAIEAKDVNKFSQICIEAGINEKTSKILKSTFMQFPTNQEEKSENGGGWPAW